MTPEPFPPYRQPPEDRGGWLKKLLMPIGVVALLLFKFKGILLGALKFLPVLLKTGGTMLLTIGLYAMAWGWKFAVGFVILLLVHECGHLLAARRIGLKVGAPVFIPFMGAFIALKEAPRDAWIEAQVGMGGPLIGTLGAALCWGAGLVFEQPMLVALAHVGFFLNLFNLAPIGFLDGGRISAAISPWLWLAGVIIIGFMLFQQFNFLLLLILILSLPRLAGLFRKRSEEEERYYTVSPGRRWSMATLYFGLALFLTLAMQMTLVAPPR